MSVRIRAASLEVVNLLLNLYSVLRDAYQNRKLLLKVAKLAVKVAK